MSIEKIIENLKNKNFLVLTKDIMTEKVIKKLIAKHSIKNYHYANIIGTSISISISELKLLAKKYVFFDNDNDTGKKRVLEFIHYTNGKDYDEFGYDKDPADRKKIESIINRLNNGDKEILDDRALMTEGVVNQLKIILKSDKNLKFSISDLDDQGASHWYYFRDNSNNHLGCCFYWKSGTYDEFGNHSLYDEYGCSIR